MLIWAKHPSVTPTFPFYLLFVLRQGRNAKTRRWIIQTILPNKQAMITSRGLAEHRFRIVFNYQCFTLLLYTLTLKMINTNHITLEHEIIPNYLTETLHLEGIVKEFKTQKSLVSRFTKLIVRAPFWLIPSFNLSSSTITFMLTL